MRANRRSYGVAALACLLLATGFCRATCPGEGPEVVLDCFSRAYSERDARVLEEVLAADYIWVAVAPPQVDVFRREDSVAASVRMFEDEEIESVALKFHDGYHVTPGAQPMTWRIEDLRATLSVGRVSTGEPSIAPLCVTLYVRKTTGDDAGYEVYREVFFEGDGCVGK